MRPLIDMRPSIQPILSHTFTATSTTPFSLRGWKRRSLFFTYPRIALQGTAPARLSAENDLCSQHGGCGIEMIGRVARSGEAR